MSNMDYVLGYLEVIRTNLECLLIDARRLEALFNQDDASEYLASFESYSDDISRLRIMALIGETYHQLPSILEAALGAYNYMKGLTADV